MIASIKLKRELFKREPKIDLLHDIAGVGRFADVTETSDGYFMGMNKGDIGFNAFLGSPSDEAKKRAKNLFNKLSKSSQDEMRFLIATKNIKLKDIGL